MNPEMEFRAKYHPDYSGLTLQEFPFARMLDFDGEEKEYRLDVITAENIQTAQRPCVFFVHGGGFLEPCDKRQAYICVFARFLTKAGYVVVSPDYPLYKDNEKLDAAGGESAAYSKAGEAIHLAYQYLRKNAVTLGIDPERIAIMGGSAGAMAGFYAIAEHSDKYRAFINLWGAPEAVPDLAGFPPTLSVHGNQDRLVSYNREMPVQSQLKALGVKCDFITLEGADHTPLLRMDDFLPQVMDWLENELK